MRCRRRARGVGALLATAVVVGLVSVEGLAGTARADASVLVAAPHGSGTICSAAAPCALATAVALVAPAGGSVQLAAGSYVLRRTVTLDAGADVSLVGDHAGATIVGPPRGPLLAVSGAGTVTLAGLTLRAAPGGAVVASGGSLVVEDATFADDGSLAGASAGGAIDFTPTVPGATLAVSGATFSDAVAGALAGAVAVNAGTAAIEGSTFVDDAVASGAGAIGGAGVTTVQADVFAGDGPLACGAGTVVGVGVFVAGGTCAGAARVALGTLFPSGSPVLAANGGPVSTVELSPVGDPAATAVPANAPSLVVPGTPLCALADARGVARLATGATTCAAGALAPDPPTVSGVSPAGGRPGTTLTLSGSGLALVTSVSLAGTPVAVQSAGDTRLDLVVPTGVADGDLTLLLTSPDGATTTTVRVTGPFVVDTKAIPLTEVGAAVDVPLVASGGTGGNRWSTSGLPPGLRLSAGAIVGQPSTPFSAPVTFTVTDRRAHHASTTLPVVVNPAPVIAATTVPIGEVGTPYALGFAATGGTPPYRFSVAPGGTLPGGLALDSDGELAGIPATAGSTGLDVAVTDAVGGVGTARFTVVVSARPPAPERYAVLGRLGRLLSDGSTAAASRLPRSLAPYVAVAADPHGPGYWVLSAGGRVLGVDGARSLGSVGRAVHADRLVGIAPDPAGTGYWVVSASGQVYGFGSAHAIAAGTANAVRDPVVSIAADPAGVGYWLLERTGRVDAYGAARPLGSLSAGLHLHATALAPTLSGAGYTVLTRGGRLVGFGSAAGGARPSRYPPGTYVAIATAPVGIGGWVVTADGEVRAFGSARLLPGPNERLGSAASGVAGGS